MANARLFQQYMEPLLRGERKHCRDIVTQALDNGVRPRELYYDLIWPAMEQVSALYREHRINRAAEHMATRINRTVADHIQTRLARKPSIQKRILIACADGEPEEFSAQMCSDLFEADGWDVYFLGGGVPHDEITALVGQLQPDTLLMFGSQPADAPHVRRLIDHIREINACPKMNVMVSGGVFNRADELWKEVKADLYAGTPAETLEVARHADPRTPDVRLPGAPKKRRRRRRPPLLAQNEPATVH